MASTATPAIAQDAVDTCVEFLDSHPTDSGWRDACVDALLDAQEQGPTGSSAGAAAGFAATAGPIERVTPVYNTSRLCRTQNEAAIAIDPEFDPRLPNADPRDPPQRIFVVSHEDEDLTTRGLFAAYTTDSDHAWKYTDPSDKIIADGGDTLPLAGPDPTASWVRIVDMSLPPPPNGRRPTKDVLFIAYMNEYPTQGSGITQVAVVRSIDGGQSFAPVATFGGNVDYPTIATGPGRTPGTATVAVSYQENSPPSGPGTGTPLVIQAATVDPDGTIGDFEQYIGEMPESRLVGSRCGFGEVAVGPEGQIAVACHAAGRARVAVDPNGLTGGADFGTAVDAGPIAISRMGRRLPASGERQVGPELGMAYDRSHFMQRGRLYLVHADKSATDNDDWDIFVLHSDDPADPASWSTRIQVNDDATTTSQFLPAIAVDETTGNVAVSWYDARNDAFKGDSGDFDGAANSEAQYWGTISPPGGADFLPNVRLSDVCTTGPCNTRAATGTSDEDLAEPPPGTPNHSDLDYGDYTDIAYVDGVFFSVWADNSNSTQDNPDFVGGTNRPCDPHPVIEGMEIHTVPEPSRAALLGCGLMALAGLRAARRGPAQA